MKYQHKHHTLPGPQVVGITEPAQHPTNKQRSQPPGEPKRWKPVSPRRSARLHNDIVPRVSSGIFFFPEFVLWMLQPDAGNGWTDVKVKNTWKTGKHLEWFEDCHLSTLMSVYVQVLSHVFGVECHMIFTFWAPCHGARHAPSCHWDDTMMVFGRAEGQLLWSRFEEEWFDIEQVNTTLLMVQTLTANTS